MKITEVSPPPPTPEPPSASEVAELRRQRDKAETALILQSAVEPKNMFLRILDALSDRVDLWRRFLGTCAFVWMILATRHVFEWVTTLKGPDVTLPRAIIGASIAGFFIAAFRFIDRLTISETLLMKMEEGRLSEKSSGASATESLTLVVKTLAESVQTLTGNNKK